jgi:two-component system response regulator YesN
MLPHRVFEPFSNSKELFADNLLGVLGEHEINCSLLFDSYIFEHRENTFKEDFTNHMNRMLTELFFSSAKFIEYNPSRFKISEKLCFESRYMDEIKQYFSLCNEDELLKVVEKLVAEIQRIHLEICRIKEISQRIYYILCDELTGSDEQDQAITIPDFSASLEYPYFISFNQWKELLFSLIHTSLDVIKYRCKMAKLGISREVIDYVQMHYKEQITLKQIADKFFVNATYLGRAFRKATGMNFNQYVNQLRITEAKKLLLHTDKLIYEIASEVGYSESKYFIVKFTEEVGKSPKEYRNQIV